MLLNAATKALLLALSVAVVSPLASDAAVIAGKPNLVIKPYEEKRALQDIVTWDEHSIFVHGERVMFYSGEFHPFRLPVPSLWLDVFQKIKALGYSGVSFYTDWALLEGEQGVFRADGIFALDQFFAAAQEAGIYLLARPGPYINAESSGGGYPGWLQRIPGQLRTPAPSYLNATQLYVKSISEIIAKAQITNGGPVILLQPENEYSQAEPGIVFPDHQYFYDVEQQYRNAGIVVPFLSNDAAPHGYFAPGTGLGAVDIYGHDGYPLGFDCAQPYNWPAGDLPTNYRMLHEEQSPTTPYSITEFQGGSFDPWGGYGFDQCEILLNEEFERVFYRNNFGFGVTIFNIYMTYGGTNWGNLGYAGGYTSYDYGAAITEDRTVTREKYSTAKLLANFLQASPAYLTATPGTGAVGTYTNSQSIFTTPLIGNGTNTNFYVVRQSDYQSTSTASYKLTVPINSKNYTIPQLSGELSLIGRDSKIHVTNYAVGTQTLTYSTADIFTWKSTPGSTVLVVYGGAGEQHEIAFAGAPAVKVVEGPRPLIKTVNGASVVNWSVNSSRTVLRVGRNLYVYILDRNAAYNYWVLPVASPAGTYINSKTSSIVAQAGYLLRTAAVNGNTLALTGDLNATTPLEIISGAPYGLRQLTFNGERLRFQQNPATGVVTSTLVFNKPYLSLPSLSTLNWKYIDSLPEIQASYSDAAWPAANLRQTYNTDATQQTPTSLFGGDYGFTAGSLVFRGHFVATGAETVVNLTTAGGSAFGTTVWLNSTYLGSWLGDPNQSSHPSSFTLPSKLAAGKPYVLTVLIDTLGLDENGAAGDSGMKNPRGILDYAIAPLNASAVSWKITGNLHGEAYVDKTRGPLNEGGMFAERQGYHQPNPPTQRWASSNPVTTGLSQPGVGFYTTTFTLNMPQGYDIPLSFVFPDSSTGSSSGSSSAASSSGAYRLQLFVNGYQFGKVISYIGPQTSFPVPEGVLNYNGKNTVALTLWALEAGGAKLGAFQLSPTAMIQTGYGQVQSVPQPAWSPRPGAY